MLCNHQPGEFYFMHYRYGDPLHANVNYELADPMLTLIFYGSMT